MFVFALLLACEKDEEKPIEVSVFKTITERVYRGKVVDELPQIDKFMFKYVYYYNKDGNMIEQLSFNNSENLESRTIWEYDSDNKMIAGTSFTEKGEVSFTYKMEYNSKGQLEKWLIYYSDGRIMDGDDDFFVYDDNGNVIESIFMDGNIERKSIYKYDENKNIIEEKEFIDGELNSTSNYVYSDFDLNDNWLKRIEYKDDDYVPIIITIRDIEYY